MKPNGCLMTLGPELSERPLSRECGVCIFLSVGVFFVCQDDFSFGAVLRSGELPKRSGPPVDQHIMQQNLVCTLFFHRSGSNVICQNTHMKTSVSCSCLASTFLANVTKCSHFYILDYLHTYLSEKGSLTRLVMLHQFMRARNHGCVPFVITDVQQIRH